LGKFSAGFQKVGWKIAVFRKTVSVNSLKFKLFLTGLCMPVRFPQPAFFNEIGVKSM